MSASYGTRLSWPQRLGVRVHLIVCRYCARFARQMRFLHTACRRFEQAVLEDDAIYLPEAAKTRILIALNRKV